MVPVTEITWYRQSPHPIIATMSSDQSFRITKDRPPLQFSDEILITLDTEGHLVSMRAVPPQVQSSGMPVPAPEWTAFFDEAGLDLSQWTPSGTHWGPLTYADTRNAWQGTLPNQPDIPVRIEATAFQGKPVSFEIIGPWTRPERMEPSQPIRREIGWGNTAVLPVLLLVIAAILGGLIYKHFYPG
jgi:hypothetical protein